MIGMPFYITDSQRYLTHLAIQKSNTGVFFFGGRTQSFRRRHPGTPLLNNLVIACLFWSFSFTGPLLLTDGWSEDLSSNQPPMTEGWCIRSFALWPVDEG